MRKFLGTLAATLISLPLILFLAMWLYPRPVDLTPAWVFEGDASAINYCELPPLDGTGLLAKDIPQGHTPGCGYTEFPQPILRDCTEPLPAGTQDIRGLWQSVDPNLPNHVERVEQCGDRIVITTFGLIHDHSPTMLSNDVTPVQIGPLSFCLRTSQATAHWIDNELHQKLFDGPTVVKRYLKGGDYHWTHPRVGHIKMKRICELPEHAKTSPDRSHFL